MASTKTERKCDMFESGERVKSFLLLFAFKLERIKIKEKGRRSRLSCSRERESERIFFEIAGDEK
jgi:hypothetical protein